MRGHYIIGPDGPPSLVECDTDEQGELLTGFVHDFLNELDNKSATEAPKEQ